MEYIKESLQRDVFNPNSERLLHSIHVYRIEKRKKHAFLCISLTHEGHLLLLSKIKKIDKNDIYKRSACWPMNTLKKIDGHFNMNNDLSFDLYFDKIYTWFAENSDDKETFLSTLHKICKRYLNPIGMLPEFINVPNLDDEIILKQSVLHPTNENDAIDDQKSYQLINKKEERDLENIMNEFNANESIANIETFVDNLTKELSLLDGANIYKLMGSELEMSDLIKVMDSTLTDIDILQKKVTEWDEACLINVRSHMEMMDEKDTYIHMIDKNKNALKNELSGLIESLDYPNHLRKILEEGDVSDIERVKEFNRAAFELQKALNYIKNSSALSKMQAVRECLADFESLKNNFAMKLYNHVVKLFKKIERKLNDASDVFAAARGEKDGGSTPLVRPETPNEIATRIFNTYKTSKVPLKRKLLLECILPYRELIRWLKANSPDTHDALLKSYVSVFGEGLRRDTQEIVICSAKSIKNAQTAADGTTLSSPDSSWNEKLGGLTGAASTLYLNDVSSFKKPFSTTTLNLNPMISNKDKNSHENWLKQVSVVGGASPSAATTTTTQPGEWPTDFQGTFQMLFEFVSLVLGFEEGVAVSLLDVTPDPCPSIPDTIPSSEFITVNGEGFGFSQQFLKPGIAPVDVIKRGAESGSYKTSFNNNNKIPPVKKFSMFKDLVLNNNNNVPSNNIESNTEFSKENNTANDSEAQLIKFNNSESKSTVMPKSTKKGHGGITCCSLINRLVPSFGEVLVNFLITSDRTDKFNSLRAVVLGLNMAESWWFLTNVKSTTISPTTTTDAVTNTMTKKGGKFVMPSTDDSLNLLATNTSNHYKTFTVTLLLNCIILCRSLFEQLLNTLIHDINDVRAQVKKFNKGNATQSSSSSSINVLSFVAEFPGMVRQTESIFQLLPTHNNNHQQRNTSHSASHQLTLTANYKKNEIETWYTTTYIRAIFNGIDAVAREQTRLPAEVVALVNFHSIFTALSALKMAPAAIVKPGIAPTVIFENEKKESRQRYKLHLQYYVEWVLNKPLEKLTNFFEGAEQKIMQGVKESEIGYQMAFNKTELRKVIKEYPGKEVKKRLDNLYEQVERYVGEDSSLTQVIWRSIQEEFIKIYKNFETMIYRCYPDTGITLEFTLDELLGYFSEIAQKH